MNTKTTHSQKALSLVKDNVAKTITDCFKHRNKIGIDIAIEALKDAYDKNTVSMDELWHYAKICRVANVMRPYLEVIQ